MRFYRIENKKGQGPYRNDHVINMFNYIYNNSDSFDFDSYYETRPTPFEENRIISSNFIGHEKNFIFGFSSKKKLIAWFTFANEYEYFEKYGFKVSVYNATETYKSKFQTIARRKDLTLVKKINFKDFIDN